MDEIKYKLCPFCSEEILLVAKKCKHCGETLDIALRQAEIALKTANKPKQNVYMNTSGGSSSSSDSASRPKPDSIGFFKGCLGIIALIIGTLLLSLRFFF